VADWFHNLTGFAEGPSEEVRRNLDVSGGILLSRVNGRSFRIGRLETPTLGDLRRRASQAAERLRGSLRLSSVVGEAGALHRDPANRSALIQVASQFNLLEMTGPGISPEAGVTRYADDHTQGPACAIAAGAATIYRNYFAPLGDGLGQTRHGQIDCLRDIGVALGNDGQSLWTMMNGYALCTEEGLNRIGETLVGMGPSGRDSLRDMLRIGVHWDVEVTGRDATGITVSQAFCSALPVSYTMIPVDRWTSFATLILEGAYEATLWAAVLNAERTGSAVVFLTLLGGGAFGNRVSWIHDAIIRALDRVGGVGLDVRIVSYREPGAELQFVIDEFRNRNGLT
jgi:hypothetical protein